MNNTHSKKRIFLFYTILVLVMLSITFVVGELSVNIIKKYGPSTFPFRQFDDVLGVTLIPNAKGAHRKCYDGYVSINQHGMRDKDRTLKKKEGVYRIGVFGDSLIEAVHVKPEETATYILEDKLNNSSACNGNCEVLNFSVGGYGALQSFLRYKTLGSQFDLDLAILVFIDNDLPVLINTTDHMKSSNKQNFAVGSLYQSPRLLEINGKTEITYPEKPPFTDAMSFAFQNSSLSYYLYKAFKVIFPGPGGSVLQSLAPDWANNRPNAIFLDPDNPIAIRAWRQTKTILDMFSSETKSNSSKFMIVHWGYDEGSNPWYKPLPDKDKLPENFNPTYASEWFSHYGKDNDIPIYNLGKDIGEYVRVNNIPPPYLSFSCDTHYNPEGQAKAADLIFHDLIKKNEILWQDSK